MATVTNKDRAKLSGDITRNALVTIPGFLLSLLALILTLIAWVSSGLSITFGQFTEWAFAVADRINQKVRKV